MGVLKGEKQAFEAGFKSTFTGVKVGFLKS
jgi:hypothetical protein